MVQKMYTLPQRFLNKYTFRYADPSTLYLRTCSDAARLFVLSHSAVASTITQTPTVSWSCCRASSRRRFFIGRTASRRETWSQSPRESSKKTRLLTSMVRNQTDLFLQILLWLSWSLTSVLRSVSTYFFFYSRVQCLVCTAGNLDLISVEPGKSLYHKCSSSCRFQIPSVCIAWKMSATQSVQWVCTCTAPRLRPARLLTNEQDTRTQSKWPSGANTEKGLHL